MVELDAIIVTQTMTLRNAEYARAPSTHVEKLGQCGLPHVSWYLTGVSNNALRREVCLASPLVPQVVKQPFNATSGHDPGNVFGLDGKDVRSTLNLRSQDW